MERKLNGKSRTFWIVLAMVVGVVFCMGLWSGEASAATKTPYKVTGVKVSSTYNSCTISWSSAKYATGYKVYRATKSNKTGKYGSYSLIKTTTARSYKNTGRTTGNTYAYKVRAVNGSKYGAYSSTVYATCKPQTTTLYTPSNSTSGVKLTWKNISGETGYKVYRATSSGGTYSLIKTTTGTSYTDTAGTAYKKYYYKVRAYKYVGYGKYVYGDYSNIKNGYKTAPMSETAYLNYSKDGSTTNTTKIYIGQTWSNELNAKLNGGTAVEKTLSRDSDYIEGGVQDIYCYDIEDFDNFLIVYVKGGKIIGWQTSAEVLGVYKGVKLVRGSSESDYDYLLEDWEERESGPFLFEAEVAASKIAIGEVYFGGIIGDSSSWDYYCNHNNLEGEEKICEYTINALRVLNGKNILEHNEYLYGDGETYGVKAWSKTQAASDTLSHGVLSEGPLAGKDGTDRTGDIVKASGKTITGGNENVSNGGCGEFAANSWYRSVGHSQNLMISGDLGYMYEDASLHAVAVYPNATSEREYWTWKIGYNRIDYGVYPPESKVVSVTDTTATLEWNDTISQFEGTGHKYLLEFSTDPKFNTVYKRAEWSKTTYTRTLLDPNTKYYFRIRTERQMDGFVATSEWSEPIEFTTEASIEEDANL